MTTYDLDTLALTNVGEDATDENRLAYSPLFLNAYNEAYFYACDAVLKPEACEVVTLDAAGRFDPGALAHALASGGVTLVAAGDGAAEQPLQFSRCGDGKVAVNGRTCGALVFVTYRRKPDAIVNATPTVPESGSVPELLPEEFHGALAAYASAVFFRARRKFERMQAWADAWAGAVLRMQGAGGRDGLKLKNAFMPMPF